MKPYSLDPSEKIVKTYQQGDTLIRKVAQPKLTDAVLGDDDFSRLLSSAAVLGGKNKILYKIL
jgi:hypothetical protein